MLGNSFEFVLDTIKTRFIRFIFFIIFPFLVSFPISNFSIKLLGDDFKLNLTSVAGIIIKGSLEVYIMIFIILILYAFYLYVMLASAINAYDNKYESLKTKIIEHIANLFLFFVWFICFFIILLATSIFAKIGITNIFTKIKLNISEIDFFVENPNYIFAIMVVLNIVLVSLLVWIFIRSMFMFYSIVEDKKDIVTGLVRSFVITRGNFFKILGIFVVYLGVMYFIEFFIKYILYKMINNELILETGLTPIDILLNSFSVKIYSLEGFEMFKHFYFLWQSFFIVMMVYVFAYIYKDLKNDKGMCCDNEKTEDSNNVENKLIKNESNTNIEDLF